MLRQVGVRRFLLYCTGSCTRTPHLPHLGDREPLSYLLQTIPASFQALKSTPILSIQACTIAIGAVLCGAQFNTRFVLAAPSLYLLQQDHQLLDLLLISITHGRLRLSPLTSCTRAFLVQGAQR